MPGVLLLNANQQFICKNVFLRGKSSKSPITRGIDLKKVLNIPIAHAEGRYFADEQTLDELEKNNQVLFRYCTPDGKFTDAANPNGAARNIAGICNAKRNVFGMMPHPERASEMVRGNTYGRSLFEALIGEARLGAALR